MFVVGWLMLAAFGTWAPWGTSSGTLFVHSAGIVLPFWVVVWWQLQQEESR